MLQFCFLLNSSCSPIQSLHYLLSLWLQLPQPPGPTVFTSLVVASLPQPLPVAAFFASTVAATAPYHILTIGYGIGTSFIMFDSDDKEVAAFHPDHEPNVMGLKDEEVGRGKVLSVDGGRSECGSEEAGCDDQEAEDVFDQIHFVFVALVLVWWWGGQVEDLTGSGAEHGRHFSVAHFELDIELQGQAGFEISSPVVADSGMPPKVTSELLRQLRQAMRNSEYVTEPIQAYIIPSGDAHQMSIWLADFLLPKGPSLHGCDNVRPVLTREQSQDWISAWRHGFPGLRSN
ncbi:hypothetical protein P7K49_024424 [Saguinus oedipus]|uniref:Uncharacterized protein n=1 Tax=Saguinus oedipus TaxID=9490 RepID=A0ABQ9UPH9_SAGOE|nr:hypothetical protein P7K49_024424 [Saguinus oedipus]